MGLRRAVTRRPARPSLMARGLGGLYLGSAAVGLLTLAVPAPVPLPAADLAVIGLTGLVIGAALWWWGHRLPTAGFHAALLVGAALVTGSVDMVDEPGVRVAYATVYVLVGLFAGYWFSTRATCAHLTLALAGYGLVLVGAARATAIEWMLVSGVVAITTVTLHRLGRNRVLLEVDNLTGLPNRTGLERLLAEQLRAHDPNAHPLALVSLDLDHFSAVNDQEGVRAGDALLRRCAHEWQAVVGAAGTVTRTGGDTFDVVLPYHTLHEAVTTVNRLRAACPPGHTCTTGLAARQPGDSISLLLGRAATARYEAKRAGSNQIVSLSDGRIVGAEALVRWQHPERACSGLPSSCRSPRLAA